MKMPVTGMGHYRLTHGEDIFVQDSLSLDLSLVASAGSHHLFELLQVPGWMMFVICLLLLSS